MAAAAAPVGSLFGQAVAASNQPGSILAEALTGVSAEAAEDFPHGLGGTFGNGAWDMGDGRPSLAKAAPAFAPGPSMMAAPPPGLYAMPLWAAV